MIEEARMVVRPKSLLAVLTAMEEADSLIRMSFTETFHEFLEVGYEQRRMKRKILRRIS